MNKGHTGTGTKGSIYINCRYLLKVHTCTVNGTAVHVLYPVVSSYSYSYSRGDHQDSLKIGDSEGSIKRIK